MYYGQTVSKAADDTGSFLCDHDPYFKLIQESDNDTELPNVTENEFGEALDDTIAENDGFVAPNYDNVTTQIRFVKISVILNDFVMIL